MPLSFDSIVHKININRFHEIDYQLQYQEVITIRRVKHTTKGGKSCKCGSIPCKAKTISLGHYSVGFQPKLRTIFAQFTLKIQFLFFYKKNSDLCDKAGNYVKSCSYYQTQNKDGKEQQASKMGFDKTENA